VKFDPKLGHTKWLKYITTIKLKQNLNSIYDFSPQLKKSFKSAKQTLWVNPFRFAFNKDNFCVCVVSIRRIKMAWKTWNFVMGLVN